jgi:4-amino-4-deoxychorismate lyase
MSLLLESIRLYNGVLSLLPFHQQRLNKARSLHFGRMLPIHLPDYLKVPACCTSGLYKCRVLYAEEIEEISWQPYRVKPIETLRLVEAPLIAYTSKWADRTALHELYEQRRTADDVLIVRDGTITDTSYCNIVFRHTDSSYYTPDVPLLEGVQRSYLLATGRVKTVRITTESFGHYTHFALVNAMRPLHEVDWHPIGNIIG